MNDAAVRDLARRAGVALKWTDYANKRHRVPLDAARHILTALGLPCRNAEELAHSQRILDESKLPPLVTATAGHAVDLQFASKQASPHARLILEDGDVAELPVHRTANGLHLPSIKTAGYHTLEIDQTRITLAVAPARCVTVEDQTPSERIWGLAAQMYGLRSAGDCGIGDLAGVAAVLKASASLQADALALSPMHALFAADALHFSPYSPSSRLFYNPLHADASSLFGKERVAKAASQAGVEASANRLEALAEVDWSQAARTKMTIYRRLYDDLTANDPDCDPALVADFAAFCTGAGQPLHEHALFEALHSARLQADRHAWNWRDWPAQWRDPHSAAVTDFTAHNRREILFHCFLQWVVNSSLAAAQRQARQLGMRVGLIADLAVGMNSSGSHAWTNPDDLLGNLQIGAPPDLFNANGQDWGLTTFSPRALFRGGFAPFIATLRACMHHAGGVRIDHAMGFMRLWVVPHGAKASEGAYLAYPIDDLLRLTALESSRHRAIVIGEDLGTVPDGLRDRLARAGIYGMRVLWFERENDHFAPPTSWSADATAMTSTHDLPTVAGWWRGSDLAVRAQCGLLRDVEGERQARVSDREKLWSAFESVKVADGAVPTPEQDQRVVAAAVKFVAQAPSRLTLLPLEDALALKDQPNLPATIDEHPNWRRRYPGDARALLDRAGVRDRLKPLARRAKQ